MPINFNVSPYFDDFSEVNKFYKPLFRPGVAVQARELNNLSAILQNQVSRVSDHLFKNGAMVIPGQITFDPGYEYVKLYGSISDGYLEALNPESIINLGEKIIIIGATSGVEAQVLRVIETIGTDPTTLYVKYLSSGTNYTTKTFSNGEGIILDGITVATTVATDATGKASAANIQQGVYYINGYLVRVDSQSIVLEKYNNTPTVKVGLEIVETLVTPEDDATLNDNAAGSPNYAAPGAHRYKIELVLAMRDVDSEDDSTFVELLRLRDGIKELFVDKTDYSIIEDTLARRTSDESGDYSIRPFGLNVREHFNSGSNNGVYTEAEGGDESKIAFGLMPSKAYVKGYEIETLVTKYVAVDKARDSHQEVNAITRGSMGNYILVDRVFTLPPFDDLPKLLLYDGAITSNGNSAGSLIGSARLRETEYYTGTITNGATTPTYPIYKMYVFDVQFNSGKTIDNAHSYYFAGTPGCTGNILSELQIRNPIGTFAVEGTLTDATSQEKVVSWSSGSSKMLTRPITGKVNNPVNIPVNVSTVNTGIIVKRTKLFETASNILIYPLPQSIVKSIRTSADEVATTYPIRRYFTTTAGGTGPIAFNANADEVFTSFNNADYMATNFAGGTGSNVIEDLASCSPAFTNANATFSFTPTQAGAVRLSATVQKQIAEEKSKTLVTGSVVVTNSGDPNPTYVSLGKADIYRLVSVIETSNVANITSRYKLDDGQRDTHYGLGSISLKDDEPNSTDATGFTITFEYFTHSSNGDYFSVNSYTNFNGSTTTWYANIPNYTSLANNQVYNLRDCFDFRPRMVDAGTSYSSSGDPLKANADIMFDFSYYLSRIDKIYLDYKGYFKVIKGTSSNSPSAPADPKDGMLLYVITLNPYTFSDKDLKVKFVENKRYTMRDIGKLEKRIENVEYYTNLNLLEKETKDLKIIDSSTGLDRFKNGFVVDPFTGHNIGDVFNSDYKVAIDAAQGYARPTYFSDSVSLEFNTLNSANFEYKTIKPENTLLTCKYTEGEFIVQPYASRIENVNPYAIYSWVGSVTLDPATDTWKDTEVRPDILINDSSAYDNVVFLDRANRVIGTIWDEWRTDWSGVSESSTVSRSDPRSVTVSVRGLDEITNTTRTTVTEATRTVATTSTRQSRLGIRTTAVPQVVRTVVDNRIVNLSIVPYIRSRYIKFKAKRLKPNTKFYPYFDGISVKDHCKPVDVVVPNNSALPGPEVDLQSANRVLITDGIGSLSGWFLIPQSSGSIAFKTGRKLFRLTDDEFNSPNATSFADTMYVASGVLESKQNTITSVIEPSFERVSVSDSRIITSQNERTSFVNLETISESVDIIRWVDPLAQTFLIADKPGGVFLSKMYLYFNTKDPTIPVTVQIREVINGYPSQKIVPFSEVTLTPDAVNISDDAASATTFEFSSPVYLQNNAEYAFVVLSNSNMYEIFVSRLGEKMINSDRIISQQPYAGSMFKSQNASTWTAEQFEDIKFTIYRCVFDTNPTGATVYFTNPVLGTETLRSLPFTTSKGTKLIRVKHPDHGMPTGSYVKIGLSEAECIANGGSGNTYNGINANKITDGVILSDGYAYGEYVIQSAELDSYIIDVSTASAASSSGDVGPNGVIASYNHQMDLLYLLVQDMIFSNTQIDWGIKTTSSVGVDGSATIYDKDDDFSAIVVNENIPFLKPRLIASPVNEENMLSGTDAFDEKSFILKALLTTTLDNISPVIDTQRIAATVIGNRVDSPTQARNIEGFDDFLENKLVDVAVTFVGPTGPNNWNMILAGETGTDLTVFEADTYISVAGTGAGANATTGPYYFKVLNSSITMGATGPVGTEVAIEHTDPNQTSLAETGAKVVTLSPLTHYKAETAATGGYTATKYITRRLTLKDPANTLRINVTAMKPSVADIDVYYRVLRPDSSEVFDTLRYTLMTLDDTSESASAQTPYDFKEYNYTAEQIGDFTTFSIKIVLKSTDPTQVPLLTDFVGIALGT